MFTLARSVFWLTAAYLVIKPTADLPDPSALSSYALSAGTHVVASQINTIPCDTLACIGTQAFVAAALAPGATAGAPMHAVPAAAPVPLPRPRPDQAG